MGLSSSLKKRSEGGRGLTFSIHRVGADFFNGKDISLSGYFFSLLLYNYSVCVGGFTGGLVVYLLLIPKVGSSSSSWYNGFFRH